MEQNSDSTVNIDETGISSVVYFIVLASHVNFLVLIIEYTMVLVVNKNNRVNDISFLQDVCPIFANFL